MAELFKRPNSDKWQAYCWVVEGTERKRVARSTGVVDNGTREARGTAQINADAIERGLATTPKAGRRPSKTLRQALTKLTESAELAGCTVHTTEQILHRGSCLADFFTDNKRMDDIDAEQLHAYAVWSRSTRGVVSVSRELDIFGRACRVVGLEPPERPDLGPLVYKPQRVLELDEQRALLLAIPPARKLNVLAYLQLGLRLSEPWKITEVDWSAQFVHVAGTKTPGSVRDVPIPDELFEQMWPLRHEWPVFKPWTLQHVGRRLRIAGERAIGVAISVNDLRGTYATHLARAGVPILTLAKIMGNSVKQLESTYAQVGKRGDHLTEAARKLPRLTQPRREAREA